ncbi:hypothetical protein CFC21_078851 [Triticum aestivum]|uniref:F-box domain-containing protein n=2 Tax=Triticum aestivum TaxID=4565 RepID=A0A3B6MVZ6_WHEAT|nr:F-box/kelch-repeat protein At3g23880-like [Triticum aestivum]KAF7073931.1 hypothetical protein CFC21_078851 [Triticum aestivum]
MSSSEPRPRPAVPFSVELPADALYEVLLRLPAKDLCRFRAVCPAWCALTSDPLFVTAHKSRHHTAPPLLATAYRDADGVSGVAISDLSGNVLKRIPSAGYTFVMKIAGDAIGRFTSKDDSIIVLSARLDLVCFSWEDYSEALWVLNPTTGATIDLPTGRSETESCAFGQVLRVSRIGDCCQPQVCEVITFDDTNHGSWRRKQDPPCYISSRCRTGCVVVDGVVYFLMDFYSTYFRTRMKTTGPGSIAAFDLETEDWTGVRPGPEPVHRFVQENEVYGYPKLELMLSLAELDGCLVMVHNIHYKSMDLWFLTDFEKGTWVKRYSMPSHVARPYRYPFLMLDDGRIFFSGSDGLQGLFSVGEQGRGFVRSYDSRNDTYSDVLKLEDSRSISIYTGSLLSL